MLVKSVRAVVSNGLSRTRFCQDCHGSGRVHDAKRTLQTWCVCRTRVFQRADLSRLRGSGRDIASVSLEITVPPGMLPGDELRLINTR